METDVLVIGGGMAGCWAAAAAATAGASVILADKGYCGVSGVTATAGPGHWWVPPDPGLREEAVRARAERGLGLAEPDWMARILDETWRTLPTLAGYYDFPVDAAGRTQYRALRGPEYMRALRHLISDQGVTILDHSPALELLLHDDGSVAGARGVHRHAPGGGSGPGGDWTIRAGAVVLATGGCAFRSHLLGAHTNTGDGHLMAAEAGVPLSGMEFSTYHTVTPVRSAMARAMSYAFARYFDEAGRELDVPPMDSTRPLARALLRGRVYCSLDRIPDDIRRQIPLISPNVMLSFERQGIDPYRQRFEVTLRGEGTVRGTGGLALADAHCQTAVPGLFAAGDVATRELIAGAVSGGGAQNSAWALSSGRWAGQGAVARVRRWGRRAAARAEAIGGAGIRPILSGRGGPAAVDTIAVVQGEMLPYDKNIFRTGDGLTASLRRLDDHWRILRQHGGPSSGQPSTGRGDERGRLAAREAAAMTAAARWCYRAALERGESRGLHGRDDAPVSRPDLARRLIVRGLDQVQTVWARPPGAPPSGAAPVPYQEVAL